MDNSQARPSSRKWWHTATVYELYPASFKDSNADGIGDIPGIISKVKYLSDLGVDLVWLAACNKSGGVDMGYDVVDYLDIDSQYGTVEDVERLIAELKQHGIRMIMDIVLNHTSDQHAWFRESRSSTTNMKRDWYIWRKGRKVSNADGSVSTRPPNNWASIFGGSAWTYDHTTDEYYLHMFARQQPDLNWENKAVRHAAYTVMEFWLQAGAVGFRMDVINMLSKQPGLPDAEITIPEQFEQPALHLVCDGPYIHKYLKEMRRDVFDHYYDDTMTVGEVIVTSDPAVIKLYTDPERRELNMAYQYSIFDLNSSGKGKFIPRDPPYTRGEMNLELKTLLSKWQIALSWQNGSWGTIWLESHDTARSVTCFGDQSAENRRGVAKMLAILQTTLGGTLFLFQGQELGLTNLSPDIPFEAYKDVETIRGYDEILDKRAQSQGKKKEEVDMSDVLSQIRLKARDHARTPIPWTRPAEAPNSGFSDAEKVWSPMNTDSAAGWNVAIEEEDEDSVLNFWRGMLRFRKENKETLCFGAFEVIEETVDEGPVLAYFRRPGMGDEGEVFLVVVNLTNEDGVEFRIPRAISGDGVGMLGVGSVRELRWLVVRDTRGDPSKEYESGEAINLRAYQGMVLAQARS